MGAVAVSQSNPSIVWAGTGEANLRNSVLPGAGVYRSDDAGEAWRFVGLRETRHIGRIIVHPTNPDIVYVAAVGRAWGWNSERGLYKTTDGGHTWNKVLYFDEQHGVVDIAMDPANPQVLFASVYRVQRDGFSGGDGNPLIETGLHAGIYKTTDGGANWTRLANGLPSGPLGRIGVSISRKDPNVVYAVVQSESTIRRPSGQRRGDSLSVAAGGIFRSSDGGQSWSKMNDLVPRPFYYGQVRADPNDVNRVFCLSIQLYVSEDAGRTFRTTGGRGIGGDQHALWIDPADSRLVYLGNDNGLAISTDGGRKFEANRNLPVSQFNAISVDMRKPYYIYGGLQDNQTWGGPSANYTTVGVTADEWQKVGPYDGMYSAVDPTDWTTIYVSSQLGNLRRRTMGPSGDSGVRITPKRSEGEPRYRFNWNAPLLISPHEPHTLYYGGQFLFKSTDRGETWSVRSPDLTRRQPESRVPGNTITTIGESALRAGLIYVGTDDGKVWVTRDDGRNWTDLSDNVPILSKERWITRLEPSHHDLGTVYLSLSRMRNDDDRPYVFVSADYGATWRSLAEGLPEVGQVRVIRESSRNQDLLFVGTDAGLYASRNRGTSWRRLEQVPTASVQDMVIHPRDRELVVATHGRGLYILDIMPLEEATQATSLADAYLFSIRPAVVAELQKTERPTGLKSIVGTNPPPGASIFYSLAKSLAEPVELSVVDASGRTIHSARGAREPGLYRAVWDLRSEKGGSPVEPGQYTVILRAEGSELRRQVSVMPACAEACVADGA